MLHIHSVNAEKLLSQFRLAYLDNNHYRGTGLRALAILTIAAQYRVPSRKTLMRHKPDDSIAVQVISGAPRPASFFWRGLCQTETNFTTDKGTILAAGERDKKLQILTDKRCLTASVGD